MDWLTTTDIAMFRALNHGLGNVAGSSLDRLMLVLSDRWTWLAVAAVAVSVAAVRRDRRVLVFCVLLGVTLGLCDLMTYQVLKPAFARPRPCHQLEDVRLVPRWCGGDFGFPSNHAANSMATAVTLALSVRRRWVTGVFALALVIGFSRIYMGVHFPGDVLAGFLIGGVFAWLAHLVLRKPATRWIHGKKVASPGA